MIVRRSVSLAFVRLMCFAFLLAWPPLLCRASSRPQTASNPLPLRMTDVSGFPVVGIVCDNLREMPEGLRDVLILPLPDALCNIPLICTLTNADAKHHPKSSRAANNVGTIQQDDDRLVYTPPDEFNANPEPQHLCDVQREPRRNILPTVRRADSSSNTAIAAQQTIILARPPVIAIHGINSSVQSPSWSGKDRLVGRLKATGMPVILADHGKKDFNYSDPMAAPAMEFFGNGPVEQAAQQVAALIRQTLQSTQQTEHLAIRRVDLLGYSYGGVVARWYLHSFRPDPQAQGSAHWYVRSANAGGAKPLYRLDAAWYEKQGKGEKEKGESEQTQSTILNPPSAIGDPQSAIHIPVRKLITVASMWRGVPLCNYVNEIHAPDTAGIQLKSAPFLGTKLGDFVDGALAALLPTRVPSMEVMAVNSPWLTSLNNFVEGDEHKPFVESVAYGCVAGDENAFLSLPFFGSHVDPYSILRVAQSPSWFPYLALERHPDSEHNYSDGLVPLWSAVIADNFDQFQPSRIVQANHDSILSNRQTLEYVACALNHRAWLPNGQRLNARWGHAITSRELAPIPLATLPQNSPIPDYALGPPTPLPSPEQSRRAWLFHPGEMAPRLQNQLYPQIGGVGRMAQDALREIREVHVENITPGSVILSWHTAAELNGYIAITHWEQVNYGGYQDVEVQCAIESVGPLVTRNHRFRISKLQPNTTYQVIVTSEACEDPDSTITVRSKPIRFTTRF